MKTVLAFLENLRPRQWSKNLLLFAGLIFAQKYGQPDCLERAIYGFLVFCFASGAVYLLNDVVDAPVDRLHPYKRRRPVASGRLPVRVALAGSTLLMLGCLLAAWLLGKEFLMVTAGFFLLNVLYSRLLRRAVLLDVVGIAFSFVLRAVASVAVLLPVAPRTGLSKWLLLCTFFLSLFLGFSKRRNEVIQVSTAEGNRTRSSLSAYSEALLNALIGITFALTLMAYSLYTIWPTTVAHFGTTNLVFSLPFVFYGMGRYLFLVYKEGRGGRPHEILLNDLALQCAIGGWILTVLLIIGLRP